MINRICTGVQNVEKIADKNKKKLHGYEAEYENIDLLFRCLAFFGSLKRLHLSECI
jgi:hypothetical protein